MFGSENISKVIEDEKHQVDREWRRFIILTVIIIFLLFIIVVTLTPLDDYMVLSQIDSITCTADTIYVNINGNIFKLYK